MQSDGQVRRHPNLKSLRVAQTPCMRNKHEPPHARRYRLEAQTSASRLARLVPPQKLASEVRELLLVGLLAWLGLSHDRLSSEPLILARVEGDWLEGGAPLRVVAPVEVGRLVEGMLLDVLAAVE